MTTNLLRIYCCFWFYFNWPTCFRVTSR